MRNFVLITIDSLRYDVAVESNTYNFNNLMQKYQKSGNSWHKVYAQATYTLPAHVSMFSGGKFPSNNLGVFPFDRKDSLFSHINSKNIGLFTIEENDVCVTCSFKNKGYRTIGMGSVGWFNDHYGTSKDFWLKYFNEFYYQDNFNVKNSESFRNQILLTEKVLKNNNASLFFFINIGSTHAPYRHEERSVQGQIKALEYVDNLIVKFIKLFSANTDFFICGDHGECFGEDDMWGHSFYHEKVMAVPACYLEI